MIELIFLLLLFSWCHDKLGVPGTERGPAQGAVAAVLLFAGCWVLGLEESAVLPQTEQNVVLVILVQKQISPANTSSAATPPPVYV